MTSAACFFINLRHKNWEKIIRDKQCQKKHEACHALNTNWLQMIHMDPYGLRNLSLTSHLIKSQTTSAPPQETAIIVLLINY